MVSAETGVPNRQRRGRWLSRLTTPALDGHELEAVGVGLQLLVFVGWFIPLALMLTMPSWYLTRGVILEIVALAAGVPAVVAARRGHVLAAATSAIAAMWVILTGATFTNGGTANPAFFGYVVLVAAIGMLRGRRSAFALAALCIAVGAGVVAMETRGLIRQRTYPPAALLVFNAAYLVMAAGVLTLASRRMTTADDSARLAKEQHLQAEIQLRESEERFHRLADSAYEGIVFTDRGVVFDANRQVGAMLGYEVSEMIGRPVSDFTAPESLDVVASHIREGYEEPYTHTMLRKDGTRAEVEARGRTVPLAGRQIRVTALRDVTEETRAAEERLRLLSAIEQAGEMIVITDPRGRVVFANRAVEQITGRSRPEVTGRPIVGLLGANQDDPVYLDMRRRAAAQQHWSGRITCTRSAGSAYVLDLTVSPVRTPAGAVVAMVGVGRDISAELGQEERLRQAQRMETVGQLAGGIAHDFNNLMSPVLGYAELLLDELPAESPYREPVSIIRTAADKARQLTQQLLAFGRKQVIQVQPLDLNVVVTEFTRFFRRTIREDVEVAVNVTTEPSIVEGDSRQLEQVLMNLAINAQDAMPHGGRLVLETSAVSVPEDVPANPDLPPGRYVRLTVTDSGGGIDPDVLPHIFEPFFTTKEKGRGTGLGLSTVYGIVLQQSGHIRVETSAGVGTTFSVFLPRLDPGAMPHVSPRVDVATDSGGSETIVVAEDDEMVRNLVCSALRQRGYHVVEVAQPEDCLRILDEHGRRPDLLLTDVVMPKVNGRELFAQVNGKYPGVKVLFMSGYLADVIGSHGVLDAGVSYIQKPFSLSVLTMQVRGVLDR